MPVTRASHPTVQQQGSTNRAHIKCPAERAQTFRSVFFHLEIAKKLGDFFANLFFPVNFLAAGSLSLTLSVAYKYIYASQTDFQLWPSKKDERWAEKRWQELDI